VFFFFIGAICFADDDYEKNFLWLLSERDLKIQQDMSRLSFFSTLSLSLSLSLSLFWWHGATLTMITEKCTGQ